jgi:hypothetical protein
MKKLYFFLVAAALLPAGITAQCVDNGDFENGLNPWRFKHRALSYTQAGCNIDTNQPGFVPVLPSATPDMFSAPYGTIVSQGVDPFLFGCFPSVSIPRVYLNRFAIKLNVNDGNADITSMYQYFTGVDYISFNYAFSAQNQHQGDPDHQPFFTARIIEPSSNTILASFCLKADNTNPIFGATTDPSFGLQILYTDWHCETLYVPDAYRGKKLLLEFVVADCGASRDFGTVYIDNVNCKERCRERSREMPQTNRQLTAYPNPVTDVLTLTGAESTTVFTITDLYGKELLRIGNTAGADELTIDVSGLATGIYLLHGDGANTIKIVKD